MIPDHPGGDPEVPRGPKRSIEAKKNCSRFSKNPDFPDPDPDIRKQSIRLKLGGGGGDLPVAKISDL